MSVERSGVSGAAGPGLDPAGRRTAGSLFAAVYGTFAVNLSGGSSEQDAYSLFVQRATSLRWLSEDTPRLWGMNDAEWTHPSTLGKQPVAWFQVEAESVPPGDSLPVQPFLHCINEVLTHAGRLEVDAVQLLLPIGGLAASARRARASSAAMQRIFWWGDPAPSARTSIEIGLELGPDPANDTVLAQLTDTLRALNQTDIPRPIFTLDSAFSDHSTYRAIRPPFDDSFWNGPPVHRIRAEGTLVEWSMDAAGWFAEVIADVLANLGCTTSVILTFQRTTT